MQAMVLNPTRSNLIALKKRLAIAEKGHEILLRKRQALVNEFLRLLAEPRKRRRHLAEALQQGYKKAIIANAYIGNFELDQMAYYMKEANPVEIEIKNVMGVRIPEISAQRQANADAPFGASLAVDELNEAFIAALQALIDVAEVEHGLKKVVLEIEKTKRQINEIEQVIIPSIKSNEKYIEMRIEEMERDMFVSLKHVKGMLEKRV
ncbi:MAG: V-type ATP synthase subunit D [Candidatus Micrarchaeaceae archaeon]